MPVAMSEQKIHMNKKQLKAVIIKEFNFLKEIFSVVSLPRLKEENSEDDFLINDNTLEEKELPKRARSITELEEKLEKLKSQKKFNLKNKLVKKSLNSKLSKKIKKKERQKNKLKSPKETSVETKQEHDHNTTEQKPQPHNSKPVFNTEGKLVFSKFDFSSVNQTDKPHNKKEKDPKKILENLKQQQQKFKELEEQDQSGKVKELKEKIAWRNTLNKAEGQKIKDDPVLLQKSIKKMEIKKKHSKKQWDKRTDNVQQKKEETQKKRRENIAKKKKEKKSKIVKAAIKRGRVVI